MRNIIKFVHINLIANGGALYGEMVLPDPPWCGHKFSINKDIEQSMC